MHKFEHVITDILALLLECILEDLFLPSSAELQLDSKTYSSKRAGKIKQVLEVCFCNITCSGSLLLKFILN